MAVVPKPPTDTIQPKETTFVMIAPPSGPASLVQAPSAAGLPKSGDLQMTTLDYDEHGRVTISGQASAGTVVRAYVDGKMVGEGKTCASDAQRLAVVQGDSLWNIARAHYGHSMHHTLINGANKDQIRNPDLIYPGQVLSLLKVEREPPATPAEGETDARSRFERIWSWSGRAIGRPEETVSDWANGKYLVDPELVVEIERITGCRGTSCGQT